MTWQYFSSICSRVVAEQKVIGSGGKYVCTSYDQLNVSDCQTYLDDAVLLRFLHRVRVLRFGERDALDGACWGGHQGDIKTSDGLCRRQALGESV